METTNTCTKSLEEKYNDVCGKFYTDCNGVVAKNDMNLFAPILKELSSECDHVTEFGVRGVCSTWALLAGLPKRLCSYDHVKCNIKVVEKIAKENNVDFKFICASTIDSKVIIEETDFLFIDTEHTCQQLHNELMLHGKRVRKYIAFHDTCFFPEIVKAIDEFIVKNPQWKRKIVNTEGCGFMVIENGI